MAVLAGPTNSGKTYQAIERLKKAGANRQQGDGPAGLFCGPLRLLALEVYEQVRDDVVLNISSLVLFFLSGLQGRQRLRVQTVVHDVHDHPGKW